MYFLNAIIPSDFQEIPIAVFILKNEEKVVDSLRMCVDTFFCKGELCEVGWKVLFGFLF